MIIIMKQGGHRDHIKWQNPGGTWVRVERKSSLERAVEILTELDVSRGKLDEQPKGLLISLHSKRHGG